MRLLFNVADRGDKYEVISINTNEIAYAGMRDDIFEVPSWEVYETVARNLNEGKKVYIPKLLDQFLDVSDLVIEELDPLETAKQTAIIKARDLIYTTRINKLAIAKFYRFFILSHYPDASEAIIANLEEYINLLDSLSEMKNILKDLDAFIESVNEVTVISMEELEARANLQGSQVDPLTTKMENEFVTEDEAINAINSLYLTFANTWR